MANSIQFRRGTAAEATAANETLAAGMPGFETDTGKVKIGDGVTAWTSLPYLAADAAVTVKNSIEEDAGDLQLVGDAAAPGNGRYYGTDGTGTKGFFELPAGSGSTTFTGLTDTPADYTTAAEKAVAVNAAGDGLAFVDFPSGGGAVSPDFIVPPVTTYVWHNFSNWTSANRAAFHRFTVPTQRTYRYAHFVVNASSGNIQIAVCKQTGGTAAAQTYERVMDSGVIACPAANSAGEQIDLGATVLEAGEYFLAMWADNTTFRTRYGTLSSLPLYGLQYGASGLTTGIPASGTLTTQSGLGVSAFFLRSE